MLTRTKKAIDTVSADLLTREQAAEFLGISQVYFGKLMNSEKFAELESAELFGRKYFTSDSIAKIKKAWEAAEAAKATATEKAAAVKAAKAAKAKEKREAKAAAEKEKAAAKPKATKATKAKTEPKATKAKAAKAKAKAEAEPAPELEVDLTDASALAGLGIRRLRALAHKYGLTQGGSKPQLVKRIHTWATKEAAEDVAEEKAAAATAAKAAEEADGVDGKAELSLEDLLNA